MSTGRFATVTRNLFVQPFCAALLAGVFGAIAVRLQLSSVLRLVADAMRGAVRQADVVGRLGGDEFAVLMPETDGDVAHAAASRLVAGIRTVFRGTPSVTASIAFRRAAGAGSPSIPGGTPCCFRATRGRARG